MKGGRSLDKDTLDSVYKLYISDVYRYLLYLCNDKYLAEDLLQDTFYRAYLYLENCPPSNIKAWLFKVAYNSFIDYERKNKRNSLEDTEFFTKMADKNTTEKDYEVKEQLNLVNKLLNTIPEKQRQALQLCVFKGLSYKEAAEVMKVSLSHIKTLVFRARQYLRENLEKE